MVIILDDYKFTEFMLDIMVILGNWLFLMEESRECMVWHRPGE